VDPPDSSTRPTPYKFRHFSIVAADVNGCDYQQVGSLISREDRSLTVAAPIGGLADGWAKSRILRRTTQARLMSGGIVP
jgi:hypothetical protein